MAGALRLRSRIVRAFETAPPISVNNIPFFGAYLLAALSVPSLSTSCLFSAHVLFVAVFSAVKKSPFSQKDDSEHFKSHVNITRNKKAPLMCATMRRNDGLMKEAF